MVSEDPRIRLQRKSYQTTIRGYEKQIKTIESKPFAGSDRAIKTYSTLIESLKDKIKLF